jgi:hypothetical protein
MVHVHADLSAYDLARQLRVYEEVSLRVQHTTQRGSVREGREHRVPVSCAN